MDYADTSLAAPYKIQAYQVLSTIANEGSDVSVVKGNYVKRVADDVDGLVHAYGSANGSVVEGSSSIPYPYTTDTNASVKNPWLMTIGSTIISDNNLGGVNAKFGRPL